MKKEIIINGSQSDWYEKAIFILKDEVRRPPLSQKLSYYADELVETYLKKMPRDKVLFSKRACEALVKNERYRASQATQKYINIFFYFSIVSAFIAIILLGIRLFS